MSKINIFQRRALILGATATVAAAAGVGSALWRRRQGEAVDAADAAALEASGGLWGMSFPRPEGGELVMAALRGRPLALNFWATWCPPCVKEMPEFERFQQAFAGQGWQVVGLAIDGPAPVREFLARVPVSYAIGLAGFDGTELSRRLGNERGALPFTVLFNAAGQIVQRKLGETHFDELAAWAREI